MIWKREEPGWYTSEKADIGHYTNGWYIHYPNGDTKGPYKTLKQAKEAAEK